MFSAKKEPAPNTSSATENGTRLRLLEIAEEVFSEKGFERTSLRDLTRRAGANLASVSYHFGSKTGLLEALVGHKVQKVNAIRLEELQAAREAAGEAPLPVTTIIRSLMGPLFACKSELCNPILVMVSRMMMEQPEFAAKVFEKHFAGIHTAFCQEFVRTFPDLSLTDIIWRFHFTISTMMGSVNQRHRLTSISGGKIDPEDWGATSEQLILFISAAWEAPPSGAPPLPFPS